MNQATNRRRVDRMTRLHRMIAEGGTLGLGDAARDLGVSSMTLRRDVGDASFGIELHDGQLFSRDHDERRDIDDTDPAYTLERQQSMHYVAKVATGRQAARLIEPGETIFIDNGTTMPHLLAALPASMPLTIVCNALNIAIAATRLTRARVHLLGGVLEPNTQSFFSEESLLSLQRLKLDKAFISAGGVSERGGASCSVFALVPGKRAAIAHAQRAFLIVDSSKLGLSKPAFFAPLHQFERVITEKPATALDAGGARVPPR